MADASPAGSAPRVALVTGAGSGIGLAVARRFVADGLVVVVGDADADALGRAESELGAAVRAVRCDVRQEADVEALVATATDEFGHLDVAVANAGVGSNALVVDADLAEWTRVLDVNLVGAFLTVKHAARSMTAGGSIVVTASLNAVQPGRGMSAYCVSKAGAKMLVEVAAMELGPSGVRVNAVGPGLVRTGLTDPLWLLPSIVDEYTENAPLGRYAEPEEIAGLVAFLASEEAGYITGAFYLVDGGAHTMRYPDIPARIADASGESAP